MKDMRLVEERILKEGVVLDGDVLKVDSFLNHQLDPVWLQAVGNEFARYFSSREITKIMTIESSGIAPAVFAGAAMNVPVIFARKQRSVTLSDNVYSTSVYSFTKKSVSELAVSKSYLGSADHVLLIDDFLANGQAAKGLIELCKLSGATIGGAGIVIEKAFQKGRNVFEKEQIEVYSLARIRAFENGVVKFAADQIDRD